MNKTTIAHYLSNILYGILLIVLTVETLNAKLPTETSLNLVLAVKLIPLLLVFPGIMMNKLKSYIWLCFIILFYFTQSVVNAWLSEGNPIAVGIMLLTTTLFVIAMMYVRWARAEGGQL